MENSFEKPLVKIMSVLVPLGMLVTLIIKGTPLFTAIGITGIMLIAMPFIGMFKGIIPVSDEGWNFIGICLVIGVIMILISASGYYFFEQQPLNQGDNVTRGKYILHKLTNGK